LPAHLRGFVEQMGHLPDYPGHLARFSRACLALSPPVERGIAMILAEEARRLAPDSEPVLRDTDWAIRPRVPTWHFAIVNDHERNRVYREALSRHVRPGMVVFEAGAGTGLLAILAAQAGAGHVFTCERNPLLAAVARDVIAQNGFADRITVIPKDSTDVRVGADLPEPADLMVAEIVDNDLLGEGVLGVMEDAWRRLLKPGAIVLPDRISLEGALVGDRSLHGNLRVGSVHGLDLSALNRLAPLRRALPDCPVDVLDRAHSAAISLLQFDLSRPADFPPQESVLAVPVARDGMIEGVVQWIRLRFGADLELSNRPPARSSWLPVMHGFRAPLSARAGDRVPLVVSHDRQCMTVWPVRASAD
jgi:type II protein arginine methyltransferase